MTEVNNWLAAKWAVPSYPWSPLIGGLFESEIVAYDSGSATVYAGGGGEVQQYGSAGNFLASLSIGVGETSTCLVPDGTNIWCSDTSGTLYQIDAASCTITNTFTGVDTAPSCFDGTYVWGGQGSSGTAYITKFNTSGSVIGEYPTSYAIDGTGAVIFDGTYIWAISGTNFIGGANRLFQVDQSSGTVLNTYTLTFIPYCIVAAGGYLWLGAIYNGTVTQVDPSDGSVLNTFNFDSYLTCDSSVVSIIYDGTYLRAAFSGGPILVMTLAGDIVQFSNIPDSSFYQPSQIAYTGAYTFAVGYGANEVARFI
jgi:hypothetical protein